jgi:hypothetical protein
VSYSLNGGGLARRGLREVRACEQVSNDRTPGKFASFNSLSKELRYHAPEFSTSEGDTDFRFQKIAFSGVT